MNLVDRANGLNNLLDTIHAIDTVKFFVQEMITGSNVTINYESKLMDEEPMTLNELLAQYSNKEPIPDDEEVIETENEPEAQNNEPTEPSESDEVPNDEPIHIEGKLGVDIDLEPEIDPDLKDFEIYKEWSLLYKEAIGILAMYNDYCTNAYEAANTCFMSIGHLRYIEYYKMLLEIYLKLEGIALSKYNINDNFKFIIKARNTLLKCTNIISVVVEIINESFDKELEINRFYYEDVDHWMKEEFPNIICSKFSSVMEAADKLAEMSQLLYKINSLIFKLDQLKFDKMHGCFGMIKESIDACDNLYADFNNNHRN